MCLKCGDRSRALGVTPVPIDSMRAGFLREGQIWRQTRRAMSAARLFRSPPSWKEPIPRMSAGEKNLNLVSTSSRTQSLENRNSRRCGCRGSCAARTLLALLAVKHLEYLRFPDERFQVHIRRPDNLLFSSQYPLTGDEGADEP